MNTHCTLRTSPRARAGDVGLERGRNDQCVPEGNPLDWHTSPTSGRAETSDDTGNTRTREQPDLQARAIMWRVLGAQNAKAHESLLLLVIRIADDLTRDEVHSLGFGFACVCVSMCACA